MIDYFSAGPRLYLTDFVDWETYFRLRKGEGADVEAEKAALVEVLETAAGICREIQEETRPNWYEEARLEGGEVVYPDHIRRGYEKLRDAGLICLGVREEYGGFDLPGLVNNMVLQMVARADAGLMTLVGLQAGVAEDIQIYASEEIKRQWLPRFVSGEVMGAMDLTEPQAGSDLGAIVTRATEENGEFFLDGNKIFITNGGCEVHLVLARDADTFDQSRGTTRGLSLFLCPRHLADGRPNGVRVLRLEEKLGIHGSPTAAIEFDHARAWRIGPKGEGFRCMLTLMNNARLGVAAQGVGISEAALSAAIDYAKQRKQFGMPIYEQPLMKNILARAALSLEGSRAVLYRACRLLDLNRAIERALERGDLGEAEQAELQRTFEQNQTRVRLLTPLAKYLATESAIEITCEAIQAHGGLGFMAESEVGKLHLDAIITTIYEGTSEIQVSFALKEIGKGALIVAFDALAKELESITEPPLAEYADKVRQGIELIQSAFEPLMQDMAYALMSAQSLAEVVTSVISGAELLRQAQASPERFDLAASWINRHMVDVQARINRIKEGTVARLDRCERVLSLMR